MEFRLLGPVEVRADGRLVEMGQAKQWSVLAVLLIDLNRPVPAERLIDRVWGDAPPQSVRNLLYGYVSKIKAALVLAGEPDVSLSRRAGGYLLEASQDQVDLHRFRRQVAAARQTADSDERAAVLSDALAIWHGTALAGLDSPWLLAMRETLELQRLTAILDFNDLALRQGRHDDLLADLSSQAQSFPGDERIAGQLMLALYRSGRQAEALRQFERTKRLLDDDFGADPGPELCGLLQQILLGDPAAAAPQPPSTTARRPTAADLAEPLVPRELPPDVAALSGRLAELAELDRLLSDGVTAVISALSGTAGVGKTALAVRWAHRISGQFPDGQLYVNLRGYDCAAPVPATDALAGFLLALGVHGRDLPPDPEQRAARYRSLLAGRRVLVLLDNASTAEQVRPLLPSTPGCTAIVTSRDSLAGLVARDGAQRLELDLLSLPDAVWLLRQLIGDRVDAEPTAAAALAEHCSRLPLALRVAAELAVARPMTILADLAVELAGQQPRRLDLLDAGGDVRTGVRTVFSWSYRQLDAAAGRTFQLISLHPGTDFDRYSAAALTGVPADLAERLLSQLARAHLIHPTGPGRYGMHDLLREYASSLAAELAGEQSKRAALTRLLDFYLSSAAAAMDILYPSERHLRPSVAGSKSPAPQLSDQVLARDWLDAHRACLLAVISFSADHGWPGQAIKLAFITFRYLDGAGYYLDAVSSQASALGAARALSDRAAEAAAVNRLGITHLRQGRRMLAAAEFRQALALFCQLTDQGGQARALGNLGNVCFHQGHYAQAIDHHERALALHRAVGNSFGLTGALNNLGLIELRLGHHRQARARLHECLSLSSDTDNEVAQAHALANLGDLAIRQGCRIRAANCLERSLSLFRQIGDLNGLAIALTVMGTLSRQTDRYEEAAAFHRQALDLCRGAGDRIVETRALNGLGETLLVDDQPAAARAEHADALSLAIRTGDAFELAHAHAGLARAHRASGRPDLARRHKQAALELYTRLGVPEAKEVSAELAAMN